MSQQIWIFQSNLRDHEEEIREFVAALQGLLLSWAAIPVLPFEHELREIDWDGPRVFYGSTELVRKAAKRGVRFKDPLFFNEETFRPSVWGKALGDLYLNADARFLTLREFLEGKEYGPKEEVFLRPDADLKSFTGWTRTYREVEKYLEDQSGGWSTFTKDIHVLVASPKKLFTEARVWVVDGEAIAGVRYRWEGKRCALYLDLSEHPALKRFVEECAAKHSPAPVFVLDVAGTHEGMKVVEINTFHAAGFYAREPVLPVLRAVSDYVAKHFT